MQTVCVRNLGCSLCTPYHLNPRIVIMPTFLWHGAPGVVTVIKIPTPLWHAAPEFVIMTTYSATSDYKICIMTTLEDFSDYIMHTHSHTAKHLHQFAVILYILPGCVQLMQTSLASVIKSCDNLIKPHSTPSPPEWRSHGDRYIRVALIWETLP